jgi:putative chitinase
MASKMFPGTPIRNNLPHILSAMSEQRMADRTMILVALATIRAETEGFATFSESQAR